MLLASDRYGPVARFFLDELYGPQDFSQRDAQFAKVVPSVVRLFPKSVLDTVASLAGLHALSERLDTAMGAALTASEVDAKGYVLVWQRCGEPDARQRQIVLTGDLGRSLDSLTRKPLLRSSLRVMRGHRSSGRSRATCSGCWNVASTRLVRCVERRISWRLLSKESSDWPTACLRPMPEVRAGGSGLEGLGLP